MKKQYKQWILVLSIILVITLVSTQQKQGLKLAGESLTRELSDTFVAPGGTFTVSYNVQNPAGPYFFSIVDSISGGCTVLGSSELVTTLTSPVSSTGGITVQAPNYISTCIFEGDWKLGSEPEVMFPTNNIVIGSCSIDSNCPSDTECKDYSCDGGSCISQNINEGTDCDGGAGTCTTGVCEPKDCTPGSLEECNFLGYACGTYVDDCGNDFSCGTCSLGSCVNNVCDTGGCTEYNCESFEYECGTYFDSCSGLTHTCGTCEAGLTCSPAQTCVEDSAPVCVRSGYNLYINPCVDSGREAYPGLDSDGLFCCGVVIEDDTSSEPSCEFFETMKDGKCTVAPWVIIIFVFVMFITVLGRR